MKTSPNDPAFPLIELDIDELDGAACNIATIVVKHPSGKQSRFFVRLLCDDDEQEGGVEAYLETPRGNASSNYTENLQATPRTYEV